MRDELRFRMLAGAATALVVVATVVYRILEDWSWVDSVYFSVVSVTTVGFGDLVPSTDGSKLFTVFYVLGGIVVVATYLDAIMRRVVARRSSRGQQMTPDRRRSVVVAVFGERSVVEQALAKDEVLAATIEQVADEAVIAIKQQDGQLLVTRAHHSVGRSLAVLTAKLMIVVPLGFHGVLAATAAGIEVTSAGRQRSEPSVFPDTDLRILSDRMEPGWTAVIAVYSDRYVDKATATFSRLGARSVWQASEEEVETALSESAVED